jgi:hypothetical protein
MHSMPRSTRIEEETRYISSLIVDVDASSMPKTAYHLREIIATKRNVKLNARANEMNN